jgi:hypothetical protein
VQSVANTNGIAKRYANSYWLTNPYTNSDSYSYSYAHRNSHLPGNLYDIR